MEEVAPLEHMLIHLLGNQADAVIRWKFLEHFVSI